MKALDNLLSLETLRLGGYVVLDSLRVNLFGLAKFAGDTPVGVAKSVIKNNFREGILWAGARHFKAMWAGDFAIALRGVEAVLTKGQIRGAIEHMIRLSARLGRVPVCFSKTVGFDAPGPI